jgi:GNAT superfamily N-acetyltransferase
MSMLSEGFLVRPARIDDLQTVLDLINTCSVEQVGKPRLEETEFRGDWETPRFDLETDSRVVFASNGALAGYGAVWDNAPHVRLAAEVFVHPDHRGQSVGSFLGRWAEERARQAVPQAPRGTRVVLQQTVPSTHTLARTLLERQGYELVRHFFEMAIEMDGPPARPKLPRGIVIRPFVRATEDRALVHVIRDTFQDHWGHVAMPFEEEHADWVHWMDDDPSFDESLWFVAIDGSGDAGDVADVADVAYVGGVYRVDGGQVVGLSLCYGVTGEGPHVGTIEILGVRRPWRRRGIALALLQHSFGELYRHGKTTVTLGVDADSLTGAIRLYEQAGMRVQHQYDRYEKELRPGEDLTTQTLEE